MLEEEKAEGVEEVVTEAEKLLETGVEVVNGMDIQENAKSGDYIFEQGKEVFDNFDINKAYVKPKHLSITGGNGQKFLGSTKAESEEILKDAIKNGKIVEIIDDGISSMGNKKYNILINAGKKVGTKGEKFIRIILSDDGGMLSAFPVNH